MCVRGAYVPNGACGQWHTCGPKRKSAAVAHSWPPAPPPQALCRSYAEDLMGGSIAIDRDYVNGTRTVVTLPLPEPSAEAALGLSQPQPSESSAGTALAPGLSWLLVDDNASVRLAHRRTLSKAGSRWAFEEASTGEAALAMLASGKRFDGIVVDMYMDKAGGACWWGHAEGGAGGQAGALRAGEPRGSPGGAPGSAGERGGRGECTREGTHGVSCDSAENGII